MGLLIKYLIEMSNEQKFAPSCTMQNLYTLFSKLGK